MDIIEKIIREVIKGEEEVKPTDKELITRMFNLLVEGAEDNFKSFKEFLNDGSCLCRISAYANVINKSSFEELNEIAKETGITKEILDEFWELMQDRCDEIVSDVNKELGYLKFRIGEIDFDGKEEIKPDFDRMTKEELIDYIRTKENY